MVKYCKDTGEEQTPNGECLIHGKQTKDHFILETDNRVCEICGRCFWCQDTILKVCSMDCAIEYGNAKINTLK